MSADSRLEELFQGALERPDPAARAAYLAAGCAGDAALQARVERLLAAHESAGGFLETPPSLAALPDPEPALGEQPGDTIGPYTLLQQIGEGGMGIVFLAEQKAPVRRKVALKVIKPGMDSRQVVARFEAERQALALMDHPHIARVLDGGATSAGRPYFVMELVNGVPITRYCDERKLEVEGRLALFAEVCRGIQHAHQKGILHRDVKPSNVLVVEFEGRPTVKIIDFGVAKALDQRLTERSLFTTLGQVVGTLEYMSPEQTRLNPLDVDTRSDVYSLGVLLYELLTGSTPFERQQFEAAALDEVLRIIREEEPPRPSTKLSGSATRAAIAQDRRLEPIRLSRLLRGDLDWIVMRALEKERDRRYATALDLAVDVERYLAQEPVAAGPPSRRYRLRKFLARNRVAVLAAGVLLGALLLGVVGATGGMILARRERDAKSAALAAERVAKQQLVTANGETLAALETLTDQVVERQFFTKAQVTDADRAFFDRVIGHLDRVAQMPGADDAARAARAKGYGLVGNLQWKLGETSAADQAYSSGIAQLTEALRAAPDNVDLRWQVAHQFTNRGNVRSEAKQYAASEADFRRGIEIYEQLVAEFPDKPRYRQFLANARTSLGVMLKDINRNAETVEQYRQALALQQRLVAEDPHELDYLKHLTGTQNNLGLELWLAGQRDEAVAQLREVVPVRAKIHAQLPDDPAALELLASAHLNLAGMLLELQQWEEAEEHLSQGRERFRQLTTAYPAVPAYRRDATPLLRMAAMFYYRRQNLAEAEKAQRQYVALLDQLRTDYPDDSAYRAQLASGHNFLATLIKGLGRPDEAEAERRLAVAQWEELRAENPDDRAGQTSLGAAQGNLGGDLLQAKRYEEALAAFEASRASLAPLTEGADPPPQAADFLVNALEGRAKCLTRLARYTEAADAWSQAIQRAPPERRLAWSAHRAYCLAHTEPPRAVAEAAVLAADDETPGAALIDLARALAVAAESLEGDERAAAASQAIAALRRARDQGQLSTAEALQGLKADEALASLRELPEFQAFVDDPAPSPDAR